MGKRITEKQQEKLFRTLTDSIKNTLIDCFQYCLDNNIDGDEFGKWFCDYMRATAMVGTHTTLLIAADEYAKKHGLDIEDLLSGSSDD